MRPYLERRVLCRDLVRHSCNEQKPTSEAGWILPKRLATALFGQLVEKDASHQDDGNHNWLPVR